MIKTVTINPKKNRNVLLDIYPLPEIYLTKALVDFREVSIKVDCMVPGSQHYTGRPIPYVTAENYVRCLSQTAYLMAEILLRNHILNIAIDLDDFLIAATNYELYYRNLSMIFHQKVKKDENFKMKLFLPNIKQIKHLGKEIILFSFQSEKAVISGKMSFIYLS